MKFARALLRDLVDKRLWPIAVALVAALVAIPLVLGGGGAATDAPAPPVAATPDASTTAVAAVQLTGAPAPTTRPGKVRDPFRRKITKPKTTTSEDGAASAGSGSSAGTGSGGTTPPTTTPGTTTPPPPPAPTPTVPKELGGYFRTEIRWSRDATGDAHGISRLTPLGGTADPAALFLGVTIDPTKSNALNAVFLVGPHATADGDGDCNALDCRVVAVEAGESESFTVTPTDGGAPRSYRLDVEKVDAVKASVALARTMRARVHPDGREVMRAMWQDRDVAAALGPIRYSQAFGLLYWETAKSDVDKLAR